MGGLAAFQLDSFLHNTKLWKAHSTNKHTADTRRDPEVMLPQSHLLAEVQVAALECRCILCLYFGVAKTIY